MQTERVIGGSGFFGINIANSFLEENYKVKTSSNYRNNKSKYDHLRINAKEGNPEYCAFDVRDRAMLKLFTKGCQILVHAGTPFTLDIKDLQNEFFEQTIKDTRNGMGVISDSELLQKVILITSISVWNTSFHLIPSAYIANYVFTRLDKPYINEQDHSYAQSKFLAEQEVIGFINDCAVLRFEIVTISSTRVAGNSLSERTDSISAGLQHLLKNIIIENPFVEMLFKTDNKFSMIDVREVVKAVFQASTIYRIHGTSYLITSEGYRVSHISMMRDGKPDLHKWVIACNSSLTKHDLGIAFIAASNTLN